MLKRILLVTMVLALAVSMVACTQKTQAAPAETPKEAEKSPVVKAVKLGGLASTEPRLGLCKEILSQIDVDAQPLMFEGNAGPATALKDGDVDGIIVNHLAWMNAFNDANKSNLVMIKPYAYYCPTRMYSSKWSSVEEIPEGATICVSNDPSNLDIALTMLQSAGLITLGEKTESYYSEADIVKNPKNVKFTLMDTVYVVSNYKTADAIICFSVYAIKGDFDATKYLYENPTDKEKCPVGLIVRAEDQDAEWAKYLAEQLATEEWINKGIAIYGEAAHGYYNK